MLDTEKSIDPKDEKRLKSRGIGFGKDYQPFIKVHEISSKGESFRILGRHSARPHHLLSRLELSAFLVFDRYHLTNDIREQFPIPIVDTLSICERLGIKHPQYRGNLTVVTSDLVIELKNTPGMVVSVKYANDLNDSRTVEKLQIEKTYWEQQGYKWKLFTEQEIPSAIKENLEWLHAANQNSNDLYSELSIEEIQVVVERLSNAHKRLSTVCSTLDDKYQCIPGFHIGVVRNGVAANLIDAPIDKIFRQWKGDDLSLMRNIGLVKERLLDVS